MDLWRYYEITHATHRLMNPLVPEQVDELGRHLRLDSTHRVLDLGCGHAELLLRWHRAHGITGIGVDASPYHAARGKRRVEEAGLTDVLTIREERGEDFDAGGERFDVAVCMGATWIWGGYEGTLDALVELARPGGAVVVGEPYWIEPPPPAYLEAEELTADQFHDLGGCHERARSRGLDLVWMTRSTTRAWDAYEMRQSAALDAHLGANPADPDAAELRALRRKYESSYLSWGHRCLGWALWAYRCPG